MTGAPREVAAGPKTMRGDGDGRQDQDWCARSQRLYRRGSRPSRRPPPEHGNRRPHGEQPRRQAHAAGLPPPVPYRAAGSGDHRGSPLERGRRGVLRAAARHDAGNHQGDLRDLSADEDHRHVSRFPPAGPGRLQGMVRARPRRHRAAGRGGLRPDRAQPRGHPRRAADRLPRLLSDRGAPVAGPADQCIADRRHRHHHRRQVRRLGRRAGIRPRSSRKSARPPVSTI